MVWPSETLKVLTILFGLQLFVMGIYALVKSFSSANEHKVWTVFLGIFSIIVALIIIRNIVETIAVVGFILGVFWIIHGIIQFVMSVGDKTYPARGWTIFMSIITVIAGIVVVAAAEVPDRSCLAHRHLVYRARHPGRRPSSWCGVKRTRN